MSNSAAVIGTPTVQTVTEDSNPQTLVAAGTISISDANAGQAAFKTTVIAASGDLGSLTIAASGAYVYSVADSKVQYLGAGDTKVDTFTITSLDGTTKQVSFTIIGVNDAAVIGAPTVVDVTEDATSPTLKATGSISISDVDQHQAAFKTTVVSAAGDLGTLVLQSNGSYTYSVADSAVQFLGAGQIKTDTFTVTALDGTTRQISFNVHGTNDAAVIGTPTVHDVTEDASNPTLTAVGSISISDADQGQAAFKTTVASAAGNLGSLVLAANGTYTYSVADSAVQYLGAGDTKVDTFTVTSLDGTTKQVSFTIHGSNDAAVIGTPTAHDVTEDATNPILYAIGTVSITDADQGQAAFQPALLAGNGNLGALIIGSNGAYIYAVLDSAVQYLGAGDTKVDTFTLTALDGTTKQVTFTIHGANDAAVIGTPTVHDVTEDSNPTTLTAAGTISISDPDQNQSSFQSTVIAAAGTLGHLTIAANGAYSYTVADSAVQYLGASDTKIETFTVTAFDGTTKQVSFTIHGVNDAAVIGDPTIHDVTKNASPTTLTAVGTISIADVDQNQSSFQTSVISAAGNLGHLNIAASGAYTYSVANSATQFLGAADTKVDSFTVTALDGTQKVISFTIHGGSSANQPAVIGDPTNAVVTEDVGGATLTASGTISVTDPDAGQAAFQTTTTPGAGDLGTLVLQSNGGYTYSVADSAVQYLGLGDTKVDTFTIKSVDGTTKVVSFTIEGANDAAVIGDPVAHTVTEDSGGAALTATGKLAISDVDQNQSSFQPGSVAGAGNLGALTFAADGTYTYSVDNSATQFLGAADTKVDTFTVTALDGTTKVVSFTIQGVNDAAVIGTPTVHDVKEDSSPVTLTATGSISISDADQGQGSFQTSVISANGNLGALSLAANGSYTYSVADSATQYLGANDTKVDTFTVTSLDGTSQQVSFTIHGTNDAAAIGTPTVHDVTEDSNVSNGNLTASGTISISDADQGQASFTGVTGAIGNLGSLTLSANGAYTYTVADSATQYLGASDTKTDTFTVTALDGTTQQVSFAIHGAQDAPTLTVGTAASGLDNANISLSIAAGLIDTSNTLVVSISGVPSGYTLTHGTISDDGSTWTVAPADLGTLALAPVGGLAQAGNFSLHVVASSGDGTHTASTSADIAVTVSANPSEMSGLAEDGYIAGATVFADANHNGILDLGEAHTTTNADGSFTLSGGSGPLVMFGGTDISTNLSFTGVLSAPEGSTVVTPLTTLIAAIVATGTPDHPISTADAASQVAAAFGLDPSKDLTTFDPVSAAISGDATESAAGSAILSAGIQVQSTVAQVSAAGGSADAVFTAIANTVTASVTSSTTVDLSESSTVQNIVSNSGVSADAASAVADVVSAANGSIQSAGADLNALAQAAVVAQGAATTQLANTDFTDAAQVAALHQTYVTDLGAQVSAAVVGVTGLALLGTLGADVLTGGAGNDAIDGLDGNDTINGGAGNDLLYGNNGNDILIGGAGDDRLDGGAGYDRASYADAAAGVTIDLTAGTVHGTAANDVANVGNDALVSIEAVTGSAFADSYNAAGFTGSTGLPGRPIGFNEFEGGGGDDTIVGTVNASGEILTRISYVSASAGVTVDIAAGTGHGTAAGDAANVGNDTFTNVNSIVGSAYDDVLLGSNNPNGTFEQYDGRAGNDLINGRGGYDFAVYNNDPTTTSGITVHLAAGTVTGDATIGTDTLLSVEAVRGTNFADTYDATGFSGTSANAGSLNTFNNFDGEGGNDTIIGNGNTRIQYSQSLAAVTVDIAAGTAHGTAAGDVANVGTDTFSGVNAVMGSMFDDTLLGSSGNENFMGLAGNDYIDGRGGFDVAQYSNLTYTTGAISVDMASGTVVGDASTGTDTLRSIEGVQGTIFDDTYVATGYGVAGALNVGNNGTFNQFEGMGGNDTITGNGNTRVIYANAAAAVTVDLSLGTGHGTAAGDTAGVGTDTFTGGVFSITGSAFGDTLIGDGNSNMFVGGGGNDTIDGGAGGDIAIFSGTRAQYTISTNGAGQTTVMDTVAGRDGTDTLTNVEALQFTNANVLIASGSSANPVDLSDNRLFFNAATNPLTTLTGSADDFVKIGFNLSGHQIDLGAGTNDTVILGQTGGYTLNLVNVEHLIGSSGNDFAGLVNNVNGMSIDMGGGIDNVNLANGSNSLSVTNVENLNGSDFAVGSVSNDTLTLLNDVSGLSVNLGNGINTLNLAAGVNAFTNLFNVDTINGSASDDTLTIGNGLFTNANDLSIDLGAGNDTLTVGNTFLNAALHNVEHLVGSASDDFYTLTNDQNGLTVDLGAGNNNVQIAAGANTLSLTNVQNISTTDYFNGTAASDDTLTLLNDINGVTVNLQEGNNTLNLAAGTNSLTAYNVQQINGSASDDVLTMLNNAGGDTIDLGAGNDTLNLSVFAGGVTVNNVEHVNGSSDGDFITIANTTGTTTVTGGGGADFIAASAATDIIRYTDASESSVATGEDIINNFDAAHDSFLLDGVAGLAGSVHFMASGVLDGSPATPHAEAILTNSGGQTQLQIDVNGDGVIGAGDITIVLDNLAGTLSDANFAVLTPNHAPTDILLAPATVAENSAAGTVVGFLFDVDPDAGDTATFALTNDAGGLFAISGGNLVTTAPLDFEQAASYQVTVQVTDTAGATFSKNIQIGVTNVNEAPTDITLSNASVPENTPNGIVIGNLAAVDPDAGDTATFSLINDAGGLFSLIGNQVVVAGPLDYEQATSHQITVRATDAGGLTFDKTLTIATTDVNEAPTAVLLSNASIAENSPANTVVGALSAVDPDAGDTATFTLTDNAGGLFAISGGNLVATGPLDFEQAASHQVTVRATDAGGLTHDTTFTIATTNVNEAPTAISISGSTVAAASAIGTVVGALSGVDPDVGDTATFTLLDNDGGLFAISGGNLVVAGSLSGVTAATQNVTVRDTDSGGLTFDHVLALTVTGIPGNTFAGDAGDNVLNGTPGNDRFQGFAGNDTINGGLGFDRAIYTDATAGIAFNLASGTVTGAGVGTDTLTGIEGIIGTNFADTYDATGFTGSAGVPGTPVGFNEFEGMGGNDTITGLINSQGAALTRVSYLDATAGVTVNLTTRTADGDASVGHDTFTTTISNVLGSQFADTLTGSNNPSGTVEVFDGRGGNDIINGGGGFDRSDYNNDLTETTGITVNLAAGTVTGSSVAGNDTLISIEAVRGTAFADTYNAVGFSGSSTNAGSLGTFNEFTGGGGNDTIIGNGNTRISFNNATAGVTVDIAAGTATGDASVGTDTFSGVNAVQGSMFDDTIFGSNNTAATETFTGNGGNDYIDGRGGFDIASYNNIYLSTGSITVNMAAGIVTGDSSIGTDTLRSIEGIQGTVNADTYDATGYGVAGALNVGNNGTFNQFEGLGGNDTITGNGNTRVIYANALAAVTVDLSLGTGHGTAAGDVAAVGTDTFTGGVFSITGSAFGDTLIGDGNSNMFVGGGGNDTINGGAGGDIAIYSGVRANYTISTVAGQTTVTDSVAGRDGTDTLTNVEALQFTNATVLIASGTSVNPVDLSDNRLFFNAATNPLTTSTGSADDFVKIGFNLSGHQIDLGAGTNDTVILGQTGGYTLNLANVEHLIGSSGDDFAGLVNNVNGMTIDMGGGNDTVNLANGSNSVSVSNVENLNGSDFAVGSVSNDSLTLLNDVSGLSVNLANGFNTLNLAAGANSFTNVYSVDTINGTASDDTLTVGNGLYTPNNDMSIDLGAGNDTLVDGSQYGSFALHNVEYLIGNALDNGYTLTNDQNGLNVDLGAGNDNLTLAGGVNSLSVFNVENLNTNDFSGTAVDDTVTLLNDISGMSVNLAQGNNTLNLAAGINTFVDIFNVQHINGSASDDVLNLTDGVFTPDNNPVIDLGTGDNTLNFAHNMSLTALNIEHINGSTVDDSLTLNNDVSGVAIDLGGGNSHLTVADGLNSVSVLNVESISSSDFTGGITPSDDTLTLLSDVSGVSVDLADGSNTLNLAAGTNSLDNLFNIAHLNATSSDDVLTVTQQSFATVFDMGDGNDVINFGAQANGVTVVNAETVNGSDGNDYITIGNSSGTTTVTGGLGSDTVVAGSSPINFNFTAAAQSQTGNGDQIINFNANQDTFTFTNMTGPNGFAGPIHFVDTAAFDGTAGTPHSEARVDTTGGNATLQIDVNGDGVMDANDIEIHLTNYTGTLHDSNFLLS